MPMARTAAFIPLMANSPSTCPAGLLPSLHMGDGGAAARPSRYAEVWFCGGRSIGRAYALIQPLGDEEHRRSLRLHADAGDCCNHAVAKRPDRDGRGERVLQRMDVTEYL